MIFAGTGEVLDLFSKLPPQDLGPAFARRTHKSNRKARIVGHGQQRRFSVARKAFDTDLLGVNGLVGFEIIESAAGAPRPSAQHSPIIQFARLAFVDQTYDSLR